MTTTEPQEPLPGLGDPRPTSSELEKSLSRTLRALQADNLIEERHAVRLQLAIELSQIITMKRHSGRVSTVANDARVLMELIDKILPGEQSVDGALRKAMEEWAEEVTRGDTTAGAAEVRDPS